MFIASLRAIMDSLYNEFLYYKKPQLVCKLPDFTYSWLGTFEVSKKTRKIVRLDQGHRNVDDKDERRTAFLNDL